MPKYSINTKGQILEETYVNQKLETNIFSEKQISEINSKINGEIRNTNKPSEDLTPFLLTRKYLLNTTEEIENEFIFKKTSNNINKSFNFFSKDENGKIIEKKEEDFKKIKVYSSYNSVFDLDSEFIGKQIFADDVDFYGVKLFIKDIQDSAQEILYKLLTIFDMILASVIPITVFSVLQMLIQANQQDESQLNKYELGKYISYSTGFDLIDSFVILILERTLNSFERLMNYPKFKNKISIENAFDDILYFILGYTMYLSPGAKIEFLKKERGEKAQESNDLINTLNASQVISDILSTLITSDSFSHPFNLLIRKILRNNYFIRNISESSARVTKSENEEIGNFAREISYLGNYFYRFIGERVSVGEKVYKIEKLSKKRTGDISEIFSKTRINDLKEIDSEISGPNEYKKNTSITSFRSSTDFISTNTFIETAYNVSKTALINRLNYNSFKDQPKNKRLSKSHVEMIESKIDSEYMPFSFHDLRTNDVFRFYAFIDSLSDGFTPNYSDSTGFGRMDPVKIYTGTTRSISLSFWLVSTSKEDHDDMWFYINRLVACVYPQWSKPEITNEKNSSQIKTASGETLPFGKPFTQIPVAPPMLRIRVGDLIKSNYDEKDLFVNIFDIEEYDKDPKSNTKKLIDFINNEAPAITNSYKSTEGKGMAGFIRSLNVITDQNITWEIDKGSRAPIAVKLDIQFDPIHDIPLGLNYRGFMRSSAYDVGISTKLSKN
jgi:hypothetical protein